VFVATAQPEVQSVEMVRWEKDFETNMLDWWYLVILITTFCKVVSHIVSTFLLFCYLLTSLIWPMWGWDSSPHFVCVCLCVCYNFSGCNESFKSQSKVPTKSTQLGSQSYVGIKLKFHHLKVMTFYNLHLLRYILRHGSMNLQ